MEFSQNIKIIRGRLGIDMSNEKESIKKELFSTSSKNYGDLYQEHLINQYKLYVEIANNTSNMRASANTYFLTINSAIIAITGLLTQIINCPLHISIVVYFYINIWCYFICCLDINNSILFKSKCWQIFHYTFIGRKITS